MSRTKWLIFSIVLFLVGLAMATTLILIQFPGIWHLFNVFGAFLGGALMGTGILNIVYALKGV